MDSEEESRSEISDFGDALSLEMRQETTEDLVACDACGECFTSTLNLAKHYCSANPAQNQFDCQSCPRIFSTKESMVQHVVDVHTKPPVGFACSICAMPFSSRGRLSKHVLLHYGSSQSLACRYCSKVFPDQRGLSLHVSTNCKMQQYACSICAKTFVSHGNLKKHILVHTGTQRFECQICSKALTNRGNLTKHMMIHSGIRPYKCEVCGRAFTLRRNLKEHLLIHQGIRPYTCSTCGKTFTQLSNLNQHLLIHAGIQDYPCELCGKCFTLRGNLKKHILIHAQEYAFSCKFCGKAFTLGGNLKKHLASKGTKCYKMNGRPDETQVRDFPECSRTETVEPRNDGAIVFDAVYAEVTVETDGVSRHDDSEVSEEASSSENLSSENFSGNENLSDDANQCRDLCNETVQTIERFTAAPSSRSQLLTVGIKKEFADSDSA